MKRFITAILALALISGLCGCGAIEQLQQYANTPLTTAAPAATRAPAPTSAPTPVPTAAPTESGSIRPDFKAAMDSYEKFFDEYVEFMQAYTENPTDVGLLMKAASFLTKYSETLDAMESWEGRDLNNAELAYYIEVTARIETKLLGVMG